MLAYCYEREARLISVCSLLLLCCSCALAPTRVSSAGHTSEELNDYGVVYEEAGNLKEAERLYRQALKKDPTNSIAASNLGNICFQKGKIKEATIWYEKAVAVSPEYVAALNNLANVQIETGDYGDAERNLRKALELAQTREEKRSICLSFAALYAKEGEDTTAQDWTQKANMIKPLASIPGVPFFRQTAYGCGPAALACVYNFLGVAQEPNTIAERVYDSKQRGSLNLNLLIDAREQGLAATIYSGTYEDIKRATEDQAPLILMLSNGGDSFHYAVVVGYEGEDMSTILVHDGYAPYKGYPRKEIERKWSATGYCTIEIKKGHAE
jgi:tetratricopeptide (TPR) repeat protein